jgi:dynein heavy chain
MKDRFIINKDIEEVNQILEDAQMIVGNCLGMRFVADIRAEVEVWEKTLSLISYVLDECTAFQRTWMYLESIFSADDI